MKGGKASQRYSSPCVKLRMTPSSRSISSSSPSLIASAACGDCRIGKPRLIELRKKMRANESATTTLTPAPRIATGAISRDEPQPKFDPPTMMSPCPTCEAHVSRPGTPSMACLPSSFSSSE